MNKMKQLALTLATSLGLTLPTVIAPVAVYAGADIQGNLCQGADLSVTSGGSCANTGQATTAANNLIEDIINIFSLIVGVVAVIMIIYGGFRYITSGGDSAGVTAAKNTILYAIIGLIIVALAQIIVKFVLNRATNQT